MKRIHATKPFDWHEQWNLIYAYSAGYEVEVSDECAAYAVGRGYAVFSDIIEDDLYEGRPSEDEAVRAIVQTAHDEAIQDEKDAS